MAEPVMQYDNNFTLTVGALTTLNAIYQASRIDGSRLQGWKEIYCEITAQVTGKTSAEGPLLWGLAANLTAAQLEVIIEEDPQSRTSPITRAPGSWLKVLGMIPLLTNAAPLTGGTGDGSDGAANPLRVKVNWSIPESLDFGMFVYNMGAGTLTTGTVIHAYMEHYGVWLRD